MYWIILDHLGSIHLGQHVGCSWCSSDAKDKGVVRNEVVDVTSFQGSSAMDSTWKSNRPLFSEFIMEPRYVVTNLEPLSKRSVWKTLQQTWNPKMVIWKIIYTWPHLCTSLDKPNSRYISIVHNHNFCIHWRVKIICQWLAMFKVRKLPHIHHLDHHHHHPGGS